MDRRTASRRASAGWAPAIRTEPRAPRGLAPFGRRLRKPSAAVMIRSSLVLMVSDGRGVWLDVADLRLRKGTRSAKPRARARRGRRGRDQRVDQGPRLNTDSTIRPDGTITMPLVGDIHAAGETPTALKEKIKVQLANFLKMGAGNEVAVAVRAWKSYRFTVEGEVGHPGRAHQRSIRDGRRGARDGWRRDEVRAPRQRRLLPQRSQGQPPHDPARL